MSLIKIIMPEKVDPGAMEMPMADVSAISRKYLDIPYTDGTERQKLDIYLPEEGEGPFPVVVFFHGGAFWGGERRDFQIGHVIEGILHGFAVVSAGYRLSTEVLFPQSIYDVKAAVRFLRAHADEYRLDPDRFCAAGASAGGYFAAMLAATEGMSVFEDLSMGNADASSAVQAVIGLFGVYDLVMQSEFTESAPPPTGLTTSSNFADLFLGVNCRKHPGLAGLACPGSYITPDCPPFLIQAGTGDEIVPYQNAVDLAEKINAVCGEGRAVLDLFPGCAHGDIKFSSPENLERMFAFAASAMS